MSDFSNPAIPPDPENPPAVANTSPGAAPSRAFLAHITRIQSPLYAYICTLLGDAEGANDVLQQTNLVLLEKASEFDESRPFEPWAYRFAFQQVRAYRQKLRRDRLVFDDRILEALHRRTATETADLQERLEQLDGCVKKLPERQRSIIRQRYEHGRSMADIAAETGQKINALTVMISRARRSLFDCMRRLSAEGAV